MRTLLIVAALSGCGSSSPSTCAEFSRTVTQRHGICTIDATGLPRFDGCPIVQWAYCVPDGLESSCPADWALGCEGSASDPQGHNCFYQGSVSCIVNADGTIAFDTTQTINGTDGLAIESPIIGDGPCEFRECK